MILIHVHLGLHYWYKNAKQRSLLHFTDEVLNRMKESLSDNNAFAAFSFLSFFFSLYAPEIKNIFTKENTSNVGRQEQFKGIVVY